MSLPPHASAVVSVNGEVVGWYGAHDEGFDYRVSDPDGPAAEALRDAKNAERVSTSVGRGGEVQEAYVEADPEDKEERATERLLAGKKTDAVAVRQATENERRLAASRGGEETTGAEAEQLVGSGQKAWVPYEGPQGGTGWRNPETDEVVYGDEPPGGDSDNNRGEDPGDQDDGLPWETKAWVPYQGPRGGSGWRHAESGRVEYTEEPPGETVDPDDLSENQLQAIADQAGEGVTPDDVRSALAGGDKTADELSVGELRDVVGEASTQLERGPFATNSDRVEEAADMWFAWTQGEISDGEFERRARDWYAEYEGGGGGATVEDLALGSDPDATYNPVESTGVQTDPPAGVNEAISRLESALDNDDPRPPTPISEAFDIFTGWSAGPMSDQEVIEAVHNWENTDPHSLAEGDAVTVDGDPAEVVNVRADETLVLESGGDTMELHPSEWGGAEIRDEYGRRVTETLDVPDSMGEAEGVVARATGRTDVDLSGMSDDQRDGIREAFERAGNAGEIGHIASVTTDPEEVAIAEDFDRTPAFYSPASGGMFLDPRRLDDEFMQRHGDWFAADDLAGAVLHEIGHSATVFSADADAEFDRDEERVAERVSDYAATHPSEFLAEVFAVLMKGGDIDPGVEELYREYDGPEVQL